MSLLSKCFVKEDNFVTRRIAGETIIVPVRSNVADLDSVLTLNEVASLIWERVDGRTRVDEIVDAICGAYDVPHDEAASDTVDFVSSLERAGLIRPSGEVES